ncbi:MAG: fibronectin type III domain-containing protein [Gemmatimonadetes bacterium]|nr:fibronectin type III domain-containing protein [Gemmatimonadota bacterium]
MKRLFISILALLVCVKPASADTPPSADFDGSSVVDIADFLLFVDSFGSKEGQEKYEAKYDLDGNGEIGLPDFLIFVSSFGQEVNCLPVFTSASTFSVLENTKIVSTIIAKDDDRQDDITGYAISGGTNQNLFEIINQNQLFFKTAPDFERPAADDNTYTVVVQTTSGTGNRTQTAEQAITITVIDVKEAPGRPAAPTISDPTLNTLTVSWMAPTNTGPDISDYDVQYRQIGHSDFISYPHTGTTQTTTITGLKSYTYYDVQIRARNDEGTGAWSASTTAVPRRLPPATQAQTPWHLTNVHLYSANELKDIQSYCTTFTIQGSVPDNVNLYISLLGQQINQIPCYGGIQTHIDGYTDKNQTRNTYERRDRGAIFSRWEERNVDAIRQAPGGLVRSAGHEGNFISVRNDFAWSEGTYRLCLRKSDVVEGAPLPTNYKAEDIAYSWGRYEHTYVRMEATDLSTNETTFIGALAFPGKTLSLRNRGSIFVEIYGRPFLFSVRETPLFSLSFSHFQVDGNDLSYHRIAEITNPFSKHASTPVMVQTSYLKDQRVIKIEVGKYTGKTGRIVTELLDN